MDLLEWLGGGDVWASDLVALRAALRSPYCSPTDPTVRSHGVEAEPLRPGESLLLSVTPDGTQAALHLLVPLHEPGALPFRADAAEALSRALPIAADALPILPPALGRSAAWCARPIFDPSVGAEALGGESFGLSMVLGAASLLLGVPLPSDVAATGAIDERGRVSSVRGGAAKVRFVARNALGVDRLLVANTQVDEACAARDVAGRLTVEIVGVDTASEAIAQVFPDGALAAILGARFRDLPAARDAAHRLFRLAFEGSPVLLRWRGLAGVATVLEGVLPPEETDARARAAFAGDVARRHDGERRALTAPDPSWLATLARPVRLRVMAHVVQSATDSSEPHPDRIAANALGQVLPRRDGDAIDALLLGSVGRAFAASRRYDEARDALTEAVERWVYMERLPEASHPLSELLRVVGIQRDRARLEQLLGARVWPLLAERPSAPHAHAFVRLAVGRALALTDENARAREILDAASHPWARTLAHVRWSRLRWLARAGNAAARAELLSSSEREAGWFARLATLDDVLETRADPASAVAALLDERHAVDGTFWDLVHRLYALAPEADRPTILAREFPY